MRENWLHSNIQLMIPNPHPTIILQAEMYSPVQASRALPNLIGGFIKQNKTKSVLNDL